MTRSLAGSAALGAAVGELRDELARSWPNPRTTTLRWGISTFPWILGLAVLGWAAAADAVGRDADLRAEAPRTGAVAVVDDGDTAASYDHPAVGGVRAPVATSASPGGAIYLGYDLDDPYRVVDLDHSRPADWRPIVVVLAMIAIGGSWGATQLASRATRRLAQDASPAFRMRAIVHATRWSARPHLSLFALDAEPDDVAQCTVRLAELGRPPAPEDTFEVDVKGVPRPGGRVVVRRGDAIWWSRGRALSTTQFRYSGTGRARRTARGQGAGDNRRPGLGWLVLGSLLITVVVAVVTIVNARRTDGWTAAGVPALATVTGEREDFAIEVELGGEISGVDDPQVPLRLMAPVDYPEDYPAGRRYPAVVSSDGSQVRLLAEPYDAVEPIVWQVGVAWALFWTWMRRCLGT